MRKNGERARGSLIAALDIGSSKLCCFLARVEETGPRIIGIGHQVSRGVRNGLIVDLEAASQAILSTVHAAEEMARETVSEVVEKNAGDLQHRSCRCRSLYYFFQSGCDRSATSL